MSSSVAPADSVSSAGKRRPKPGKRERQAARSATGSAGGAPASADKARQFASGGMMDPVPQPGKFPVVFQTGVGEPTRDQEFAPAPDAIAAMVVAFPDRYRRNPRYAEFRANADLTDDQFGAQLTAAAVLRLAQQIVHAHANLGLPQGDFAPVASSEVFVPSAISVALSQIGEFPCPITGTRYLLRDYEAMVARLVLAADQIWSAGHPLAVLRRMWLPMSANDGITKTLIAERLNRVLRDSGISILAPTLEDAVLSGTVPDAWESIKSELGEPPGEGERDRRDRFDFLFKAYRDVGQFTTAFTTDAATGVLSELGLVWVRPSAGHLDWQYMTKSRFSSLADQWARLSSAYAQFFELSSGLASRSSARGSLSQLAEVSVVQDVTVVKTALALSAPELSLVTCFPATGVFVGGVRRNVVVTTSLNVAQRATEFCLRDWR